MKSIITYLFIALSTVAAAAAQPAPQKAGETPEATAATVTGAASETATEEKERQLSDEE